MQKELQTTINIKQLIGVSKPFAQGGSWRVTLPKLVVKKCKLEGKSKEGTFFSFAFIDTNKGILLVPLEELVSSGGIAKALV